MTVKLILRGQSADVTEFVKLLIVKDLNVNCVIVPEEPDDTQGFQSLLTASTGCTHLRVMTGSVTDFADADDIILFEGFNEVGHSEQPEEQIVNMLSALRRTVAKIVDSGFTGNILMAGPDDGLMVTFALKSSGMAANRILGLGTFPESRLLSRRLAKSLGVGHHDVHSYVVGQPSDAFVTWSRTSVGPAPILMYLANADTDFGANDMSSIEDWITDERVIDNRLVQLTGLIRLTEALIGQKPVIATVNNRHLRDKVTYAIATPVLVNETGVNWLTDLVLSDDEQRQYESVVDHIMATQARIETIQRGGETGVNS